MPSPVCCQYSLARPNSSFGRRTAEIVGDRAARDPVSSQSGARPRWTRSRSVDRMDLSPLARIKSRHCLATRALGNRMAAWPARPWFATISSAKAAIDLWMKNLGFR